MFYFFIKGTNGHPILQSKPSEHLHSIEYLAKSVIKDFKVKTEIIRKVGKSCLPLFKKEEPHEPYY